MFEGNSFNIKMAKIAEPTGSPNVLMATKVADMCFNIQLSTE